MSRRSTPRPLAAYFAAFAAAVTVPVIIMMIVVTNRYTSSEQARLQGFGQTTLSHIASSLDRSMAAHIAMLQALATSPAIKRKDYQAFDRQVRELAMMQDVTIVLRDADGRQVVNTQVPLETSLPVGTGSGADAIVAETGRPHVSNLFLTLSTRQLMSSITVPVAHDDQSRGFLSVNISPAYFANFLKREAPPAPYHISIADRDGRIIARSIKGERFLGEMLPGFPAAKGPKGTWSGSNPQGIEVVGFYERLGVSDWLVSMGVEKAALEAPLHSSLSMLGMIGAALLLIGGGLATGVTRTITTAFQDLRSLATRLPERTVLAAPTTPIAEANVIGGALASASSELRRQADALEHSKQELEHKVEERTRELSDKSALFEATLDNMDQGLFMIDAEGRVPIYNRRALELLELSKEYMDRRPHLRDLFDLQAAAGEFDKTDEATRRRIADLTGNIQRFSYERERPNGTVIEVHTVPIDNGGAVRTFSDVTERHRTTQRVIHLAHHDPLTGLANRVLFQARLEQALAEQRTHGRPFSVLFLDLDHFKAINDSMGHSAGDTLITIVAQRLPPLLREGDTVARLGGDEFAIVRMVDGDPKHEASMLADRLLMAVGEPFELRERRILTSASIGIAIAPADGGDVEQLLRAADLALYKAKSDGRNEFRFFERDMDLDARERHALDHDLRNALARNELELHYQPVVRASDQALCGVEALIRWRHPERGMVPPAAFVPLAEETGLIVPIGAWVLRQACADAAGWPAHVKVAVNLSPVQLRKHMLVKMVSNALAESGLPPERLELEITETVLLEKEETSLSALHALRRMGVSIVLDDFGTGYSSLSYLRAFPFDKIKIDKSFVDEMLSRSDCAAIVSAVAGLARTLNMATTAEGVETPEQLALLRAAGCGQAQGYLFSCPRSAKELVFDQPDMPMRAAMSAG